MEIMILEEWKHGREFIKTAINQAIDIKNLASVKKIIDNVFENLITDLSKDELIAYGVKLIAFDTSNMDLDVLPGETKTINGISFFMAYEEKTTKMFEDYVEKIK